eukprot:SAG11_NODE_1368_length_5097_cov_3.426170_2_plen_60_part_00
MQACLVFRRSEQPTSAAARFRMPAASSDPELIDRRAGGAGARLQLTVGAWRWLPFSWLA